jgi:hypothetical protein
MLGVAHDVQRRDEIDEVAEGKRAIGKLFSEDQERFVREFYTGPLDYGNLRVLGPIACCDGSRNTRPFRTS